MPNPPLPAPWRHGAAGSFTERLLARDRCGPPPRSKLEPGEMSGRWKIAVNSPVKGGG
jgi:hypothetical protein